MKVDVESAFVHSSIPETPGFFYNPRHTMVEYFLGLQQIEPALVEDKAKQHRLRRYQRLHVYTLARRGRELF
ncbi:Protein of unknown function [Pyronema omphalodes CBS 100304]|uniref:Uncharacterized protein n=1 Tax=Pyronema omphalodes (strain CBS 100304) TaxID=1076935 RepID=U4LNN3_PYROM|nr:Protein of unknown function [Pyronema omphalodes CBS 100304]